MRLIDGDYVLAYLKPHDPSDKEWSVAGGTTLRLIYTAINQAPTIDAVEVVRCQNCKHSAEWERGLWCTWHDDMYAWENYFCADGKRKDEE